MKTSEQFTFVYEDLKKALFNALIFGSPLLLLILTEIQSGKEIGQIKPLIGAWFIQTGIDLTKKFIKVNTYKVK